jgi:hypothetical protein
MRSDDPKLYGDTFLQGVSYTQEKHDRNLVRALHKAYEFGESTEFRLGITVALRVIREETYNQRFSLNDLSKHKTDTP